MNKKSKQKYRMDFGFRGKNYETNLQKIDHTSLEFWPNNPRIYNKIRKSNPNHLSSQK